MKILMINSNRYKLPAPIIPFGLCRVSAAVEQAGHDVRVLDLCFSNNCTAEINKAVAEFKPDITGISVRNIDTACLHDPLFFLDQINTEIISPLKKAFTGPIVIGGPAVGISGSEMLSLFDLEFALRGDGEKAFIEFIKRIENKSSLKGLGGLIWRKAGNIVENNNPLIVNDIDSLPSVNYNRYVNVKKYSSIGAPIPIQTKRGCELHCTYCTYNIVEGHNIRLRSPQAIADEIEKNVKEYGNKYFEFTDSTFNIPLDHAKATLRAIIAKKLDIKLQTMGLNPGAIDEEFADLLKEADFKELQLGVESGSDITLKGLGKNYTKADILRAGDILRKTGIPIMWWILTGAPGETVSTLTETFDTIKKAASKWDLIVVANGIRAYKGAPLSKKIERENPGITSEYFLRTVPFEPKTMKIEEIRLFNKKIGLKNPNFLFFDEVQRLPFPAVVIQNMLMKLLAPNKPWWKSYIFMNYMQKFMGIGFVKELIFNARNLSKDTEGRSWESTLQPQEVGA